MIEVRGRILTPSEDTVLSKLVTANAAPGSPAQAVDAGKSEKTEGIPMER